MKIKTVIISLPNEKERRLFIQEEIKRCNITDYVITDGVNGRNNVSM